MADTLADIRRVRLPRRSQHDPPGSPQGARKTAHRRDQDRRRRPPEDRFAAQDHPGRLAGVGDPLPQVLQRRSEKARPVIYFAVACPLQLSFLVCVPQGSAVLLTFTPHYATLNPVISTQAMALCRRARKIPHRSCPRLFVRKF